MIKLVRRTGSDGVVPLFQAAGLPGQIEVIPDVLAGPGAEPGPQRIVCDDGDAEGPARSG